MVGFIKNLLLLLLFTLSTFSFAGQIMETRVILQGKINRSYIDSVEMFLTNECDAFILVDTRSEADCIFSPEGRSYKLQEDFGLRLNGFIKDGHPVLAFGKDNDVVFYDVSEGFKPTETIHIAENKRKYGSGNVIATKMDGKCYMLFAKSYSQPFKVLKNVFSGGHAGGDIYQHVYLAEIEGDELSNYRRIKFGHKSNVTFSVKTLANDAKMIHFLGFIQSQRADTGSPPLNSQIVLHYSGYDLERKKITQKHNIYQIKFDPGSHSFGPLSMACEKENVFVVFPLKTSSYRGAPLTFQNIRSDIYYFQYFNDVASGTEKIGEGYLPQICLDSNGMIYVFWIDSSGNLIYISREKDSWSKSKVVLGNVDLIPEFTFKKHIDIQFDSENNLHLVFPSEGNLIYEKRRFLGN